MPRSRLLVPLVTVWLASCAGTDPARPPGASGGTTPASGGAGGGGGAGGVSPTPIPTCGGNGQGTPDGGPNGPVTPASPVAVTLAPEQQREAERLGAIRSNTADLTAAALLEKRKVPFRTTLGYDPRAAVNLPLIQASALKLDEAALAALGTRGFVISDKHRYPHFAYGYKAIYSQDLPVFISADSILQAVHQSYSDILKQIEQYALRRQLEAVLASMQARIANSNLEPAVAADADLFVAVALSLLRGEAVAPVGRAKAEDVAALVKLATAAQGREEMDLLGARRWIDFSQFEPRGHYADSTELRQYFRAMIWLGRTDLPLLQTQNDGKQTLLRHSVALALGLRALMDEAALAGWRKIDETIRAFVGEPDSMGPGDVDRLRADLGLDGYTLGTASDQAIATALVKGAYGQQRILSQVVIQPLHRGETWPLDATFLFMGQRYVFDSHVFGNVIYDRWNPPDRTVPRRMMPNPLDAAYAALRNDQAAALLRADLEKYKHAPALESTRLLGDEHPPAFWGGNLYNLWLGALQTLSPIDLDKPGTGLPAVAATEPWGRRLLSTQLASWAQLRHDTILYAKQSYTPGVACEFPDAYVEPYPAFFAAIEKLAAGGLATASRLAIPGDLSHNSIDKQVGGYFDRLGKVAATLREMAEHQRTGAPHKPEHLAFVNQAVDLNTGCGGPASILGWYAELYFNREEAATFSPTIADVHTQPTDEDGSPVGHVLHVGTGYPRLMVMTVETCMGPRAYAGVVSTYHEHVTEKLERLTDAKWKVRFTPTSIPADVPWMQDLVTR